jgi:hypothetical protein
MDDYPHIFLIEDGRLCSMGQHCPGFPRVLYDALLRLVYNGDVPIYRCHLCLANGLDVCKASVMIPFDPMEPWTRTIVGTEPNTTVEQTTHVTLTSLCESRLIATAAMPITFSHFRIRRILCGSSALRPRLTSRALTSTPAWPRWPSTFSTCLTCNTTLPGPSHSSVCI